jgi:hypothetical protein
MIRYLTLIVFNLILISNFSFGQTGYQEVVYLKNGSVIRGVIIEQVPNKALKIETADGNIFVFEMDEIEKITKEKIKEKEPEKTEDETWEEMDKALGVTEADKGPSTDFKKRGFNCNLDFGVFIDEAGLSVPLRITLGGYIGRAVQLGFGTGVDIYTDPWLPAYLDLRINLLPYRVTPQFVFNGGYAIDLERTEIGGFMGSGGLGVKFFFPNNKTAMSFTFGYNYQQARYRQSFATADSFFIRMGFQL